jgi:hypothetical protein
MGKLILLEPSRPIMPFYRAGTHRKLDFTGDTFLEQQGEAGAKPWGCMNLSWCRP